jgi:hypothetical protein
LMGTQLERVLTDAVESKLVKHRQGGTR